MAVVGTLYSALSTSRETALLMHGKAKDSQVHYELLGRVL